MAQVYSDPSRETDPHALPDVEVFYASRKTIIDYQWTDYEGELLPAGWYWWSCFPGCLPDSEPNGPFNSEAEATADVQSGNW